MAGINVKKNNQAISLSILMIVLITLLIFFVGKSKKDQQPFGLGDYSNTDLNALTAEYETNQSNEALVELLSALCFKAKEQGDESVIPLIERYGTELFDRAREEKADLQKLDSEERMLELIRWIKMYGAK